MKRWVLPCCGISLIFAAVGSAAGQSAITDKTMVVWAAPANLSQRGGSAITVDMANPDAFDAIVFGELTPRKWMAGSTLGKRTQRNQDACAAEPAGSDEFVQMAIVYQGRHVTIYRNRQKYASYEMPENPQTFDKTAIRPVEQANVYVPPNESVEIRVFIDRSVIEVFAAGRQAAAVRVFPSRESSDGVSLLSVGADSVLQSFDAWQMESIYR
jgi:hypothetical protein